jgi:hypothetical protein
VTRSLFALERRFEVGVLYIFQVLLLATVIFAVVQRDWWLVGICVVAFFFNGSIGQGLQKNRRKSFTQLSAGSSGEPVTVDDVPANDELFLLARSAIKFRWLAVLTAAAITYHFGQRWWVIISAMVAAWAFATLLTGRVFWKGRERGQT